ncbi:MAG TPA: efflux RND transporter periplasmic adaptor subunit [Gammaproteobacteria bacterium]|nr:efflux RND transporter periplasmic adaptor subunit [Gammaproteobacteria bacterium]
MRKKILILFVLGASFAALSAYKIFHRNAVGEMNSVLVKASQVQETELPQEIHVIGTLAARSVQITPEMPGHVNAILFKDGAFVSKGDVLVQLDDAVYKAKFESAKAKFNYSDNNYRRMALLGKKGIIAQQAIDQADSDLKERRADMQEAEVMLNKMKLTAPFDGVVGSSRVNPGDYVTIGQNIVALTDTRHLRIEYSVPEKYLPHVKIGQKISVTAAAFPGKTFTGVLSFISPTINTDNRSIALYAEIDNPDNLLAAGMFVEAQQMLGSMEHALMIPSRSIMPVLEGAQVYKIVDGKAFSVNVMIGQRTADTVQITQGLSKHDTVITDGQLKVKNGTPVKVQS